MARVGCGENRMRKERRTAPAQCRLGGLGMLMVREKVPAKVTVQEGGGNPGSAFNSPSHTTAPSSSPIQLLPCPHMSLACFLPVLRRRIHDSFGMHLPLSILARTYPQHFHALTLQAIPSIHLLENPESILQPKISASRVPPSSPFLAILSYSDLISALVRDCPNHGHFPTPLPQHTHSHAIDLLWRHLC